MQGLQTQAEKGHQGHANVGRLSSSLPNLDQHFQVAQALAAGELAVTVTGHTVQRLGPASWRVEKGGRRPVLGNKVGDVLSGVVLYWRLGGLLYKVDKRAVITCTPHAK